MDAISSSNFHYLVGLIATDGHIGYPGCTVSTKTYYCNIKLNQSDKQLLYDIQKIFGGTVNSENKKTYCWRVSNKEFIEYLMRIGMSNTKTYDLDLTKYFESLSIENKYAFLRGVIDGDGSISIQNRVRARGMQCGFNICSASKPFISMIETYFGNGTLTERKKEQNIKATCSLYYYYINGSKIPNALKNIYKIKPESLVMERKLCTYAAICAYYSRSAI